MDVTLIIRGALAERLRHLAAAHGVNVEVLGQEALAAGLTAAMGDADISMLGTIPLPTASPDQSVYLRSPIIAHGPVPQYSIEILTPQAGTRDAD